MNMLMIWSSMYHKHFFLHSYILKRLCAARPLTCCSCRVSCSLWLSGWLGISFSFSSHLLFSSSTLRLSSSRLSRSCSYRHGRIGVKQEYSHHLTFQSKTKTISKEKKSQFHNHVYRVCSDCRHPTWNQLYSNNHCMGNDLSLTWSCVDVSVTLLNIP